MEGSADGSGWSSVASAGVVNRTAPASRAVAGVRARVDAVDALRGLVMIIMALDHTRDYFGDAAVSPTNLAQTSVALFLTRWVTHLCAPTFFLLTGTGAYLAMRRRGKANLSKFLLTRGLWLILLEFTVMRFILQFNVDYHVTVLTVLWALGWSMIALSALVWLPTQVIAAFGVLLIVTHNMLDGMTATTTLTKFVALLHTPSMLFAKPGHMIFAAYPLIPWIGVTALGYALGALYDLPAERRRRLLVTSGAACTVAFVLLRGINVYGDASRWSVQPTAGMTLVSFLNVTKYPPSLLFLLMTLGPAMMLLAAFDRGLPGWLRAANVFGKVPMFYYLAHFALIHLLVLIACVVRFGSPEYAWQSPDLGHYPFTQPAGWAAPLPVVWLVWASVVIALYPVCRWYASLRARRSDWWLSYL